MSTPTPTAPDSNEHAALAVEVWQRVVQTQEHFNEICMKVRTLYATVLAGILSLYGVFIKDSADQGFTIGGLHFDPIIPVCIAIFVVTTLFYFVDKEWYHRLLLGAVAQGADIEARWAGILPEIQLGSKITDNSPVDLSQRPKLVWFLKFFVHDPRFRTQHRLHSDAKVEVFYKPIRGLTVLVFLAALLFGGLEYDGRSLVSFTWHFLQALCDR